MLPDSILPTPEDDIARILANFEKRISHLERLENFLSGIGARVFNSANISVANNVFVDLTFDSERFDTDSIHSAAVNPERLTANTAGVYVISATILWAASAVGFRYVLIRLNGANRIDAVLDSADGSNGAREQSLTTIWEMAIADYVTCEVRQSSGGNLNVDFAADRSPEFMMQKIG